LTGGGLIQSAEGWSALKALRSKAFRIMGDERILGSSDFVEAVLKRWKRNRNQVIRKIDVDYGSNIFKPGTERKCSSRVKRTTL
jgi:hypothetical protein